MAWTDERTETLRRLWITEGKSAREIAKILGGGVTRNAVIGKVHTLGLGGRPNTSSHQSAPTPQKAYQPAVPEKKVPRHIPPAQFQRPAYAPRQPLPPSAPPEVVAPGFIPEFQKITLAELRMAMCRWPLGDPSTEEFRYCGNKSPLCDPYCPYHARLAYQPKDTRQRVRKPFPHAA